MSVASCYEEGENTLFTSQNFKERLEPFVRTVKESVKGIKAEKYEAFERMLTEIKDIQQVNSSVHTIYLNNFFPTEWDTLMHAWLTSGKSEVSTVWVVFAQKPHPNEKRTNNEKSVVYQGGVDVPTLMQDVKENHNLYRKQAKTLLKEIARLLNIIEVNERGHHYITEAMQELINLLRKYEVNRVRFPYSINSIEKMKILTACRGKYDTSGAETGIRFIWLP